METSETGIPPRSPSVLAACALLAALLAVPVRGEIFTSVLDPRGPSFAAKTELSDTIVVAINAARGNPPDHRRKAKRTKGPVPCAIKGKNAKARAPRLLQNAATTVCLDYSDGVLRLRSRRAGSDSLVEWIPVRLSDMPRSSIEQARLVTLEGATLLELDLREQSGQDEGRVEDRSLILIDPVRERWLVNVMRSHEAEGGRDEGNFSESCEGVAQIRGDRVVLGGYACEEESEGESPSGEITTYTRSSGPDPEFRYRYRGGFLFQDR